MDSQLAKKPTTAVSVIIPTYNRVRLVGRAIQSVLSQTFTDLELIVVDDASTDDTAGFVANIGDSRIRYVRLERNHGVSVARNTGVKMSRGKYIAFLDSDDEWEYQKLEKQLQVFLINKSKGVEVVGCGVSNIRGGSTKFVYPPADRSFYEDLISPSVSPTLWRTLLVEKCLLQRTGISFDKELRTGQDRDFFIRLSRACEIAYVNEPLVKFYDDANIRNTGIEYIDKQIQSRLALLVKYADELKCKPKVLAQRHMSIALLYKRTGNFQAMKSHMHCAVKAWHSPKHVLFWFFSMLGVNTFKLFYWAWTRLNYLRRLVRYIKSRLFLVNDDYSKRVSQ